MSGPLKVLIVNFNHHLFGQVANLLLPDRIKTIESESHDGLSIVMTRTMCGPTFKDSVSDAVTFKAEDLCILGPFKFSADCMDVVEKERPLFENGDPFTTIGTGAIKADEPLILETKSGHTVLGIPFNGFVSTKGDIFITRRVDSSQRMFEVIWHGNDSNSELFFRGECGGKPFIGVENVRAWSKLPATNRKTGLSDQKPKMSENNPVFIKETLADALAKCRGADGKDAGAGSNFELYEVDVQSTYNGSIGGEPVTLYHKVVVASVPDENCQPVADDIRDDAFEAVEKYDEDKLYTDRVLSVKRLNKHDYLLLKSCA